MDGWISTAILIMGFDFNISFKVFTAYLQPSSWHLSCLYSDHPYESPYLSKFQTYIPTYIHTYLLTYLPTCLPTYLPIGPIVYRLGP